MRLCCLLMCGEELEEGCTPCSRAALNQRPGDLGVVLKKHGERP